MTGVTLITVRPGTPDDQYPCFVIFQKSLVDLVRRQGGGESVAGMDEPDRILKAWDGYQSLYDLLGSVADQFWVAEQDGQVIGYARSQSFDGTRELTEFFVRPGVQSGGIGRELLRRAFPADTPRRTIIATTDARAQALYMRSGLFPFVPCLNMVTATPTERPVESDLDFVPLTASHLGVLADIDRAILGFRRDAIHQWFIDTRHGFLYQRGGKAMGYGYEGVRGGPFALRDPDDFPAVLAHAENDAARESHGQWFVVPGSNHRALACLLERGFRVDPFVVFLMTSGPFGQLDRYVITSPEFFL